MNKNFLIIDFDSTFTRVEALDELAKIALANDPQKDEKVKAIAGITKQGMEGKISFQASLKKRLELFSSNQSHLNQLVKHLKNNITPSFLRNKKFIQFCSAGQYSNRVYIISGGFHDFIDPVVLDFGIPKEYVLANTFQYDQDGNVVGFDTKYPLAQSGGKPKVVKDLKLSGTIHVIGDGITDYQIKEAGAADFFYAFTENVRREVVVKKADREMRSFGEIISILSSST